MQTQPLTRLPTASAIMRMAQQAANIWPMILTKEHIRHMKKVSSLDIYDGASAEFHDEGLYSTSIFGRVGSEERSRNFAYIDLKVRIFHPKIFKGLMSLKGLYREIVAGKTTAVFDKTLKDFVPDTSEKAETGYSFFARHFPDMKIRRSKSPTRALIVEMIEKYQTNCMFQYLPVMPAGLRDVEIDESGNVTKNEFHDPYFRALSISNTIPVTNDMESPALDIARNALTNTVVELYDMIEQLLSGKNGFILDKWASRRIAYGTRNVLTVMDTSIGDLRDKNSPGFDATTFGLFQVVRGMTPLTIHYLRRMIQIDPTEGQTQLIDKKTLKPVWVELTPQDRDMWSTRDGLNAVIERYRTVGLRARPVEIQGHYLALVYRGPDMTFRIFRDIDELPSHLSRADVHPISLVELIYLSGYSQWNKRFAQVCRYPISGKRSIYASRIYVKTTVIGEQRTELDDNWQPYGDDDHIALEYPRLDLGDYMDSQSPHSSKLKGLAADQL